MTPEPRFRAPSARAMAQRVLDQVDSLFDQRIVERQVVYVRGYEIPVSDSAAFELKQAFNRLTNVRRRIVENAALERKRISDQLSGP